MVWTKVTDPPSRIIFPPIPLLCMSKALSSNVNETERIFSKGVQKYFVHSVSMLV